MRETVLGVKISQCCMIVVDHCPHKEMIFMLLPFGDHRELPLESITLLSCATPKKGRKLLLKLGDNQET